MDIFDAIQTASTDASDFYARMDDAARVRRAEWDGQSPDGRKRGTLLGRDAFPWEGASDMRVFATDGIINEQTMMMKRALFRSRIQAAGMESSDGAMGNKVSIFLRFLLWNRMKTQMLREVELAAQWRQWFGCSASSIMWDQQVRRMEIELTLDGLLATLMTPEEMQDPAMIAQGAEAVQRLVFNFEMEGQAVDKLMSFSEILTRGTAKRKLAELRNTGRCMIPVPEVFGAMPRVQALIPFLDVFWPAGTSDIQRAPWVAVREEITPEDLEERIETFGYDAEWVAKAINQKGMRFDIKRNEWWGLFRAERYAQSIEQTEVEIWHVYSKEIGEDGFPVIKCRTMHSGQPKEVGKESDLPYEHGEYPVVVHVREHAARAIIDSRGICEIGKSGQDEIKVQRDARTDRTSISTLPPLIKPARRGKVFFGPGSEIPSSGKNEDFRWMQTPPYDGGSLEIEKATERSMARYFGQVHELVPPQVSDLYASDLVDGWLMEYRCVIMQVLQLCMQYMPENEVVRVTGPLPRPWQFARQEIQGLFDFSIEADPRDLNLEQLKEKWGFVETILKYDRAGRVDYGKLVEIALGWVDPSIAGAVLIPMENAAQKQMAEEQDALAKMLAGIEPSMEPAPGMNYQMRMQVLQESIQRNPEMQRRIASQPDTAALIENRMKFLSFQVQQEQNAMIGRVGAEPIL